MYEPNHIHWELYLEEGNDYYRRVSSSIKQEQLSSTGIFNILKLALEKYWIGFLLFNHQTPENSTSFSLQYLVSNLASKDALKFQEDMLFMDSLGYSENSFITENKKPSHAVLYKMLQITENVKHFVENKIYQAGYNN
jgi:hypothetical protein